MRILFFLPTTNVGPKHRCVIFHHIFQLPKRKNTFSMLTLIELSKLCASSCVSLHIRIDFTVCNITSKQTSKQATKQQHNDERSLCIAQRRSCIHSVVCIIHPGNDDGFWCMCAFVLKLLK